MGKHGLGKFLAGAAIGAGLGLLFSPKSGEDNRKDLKAKLDELMEQLKGVKAEDVKDYFEMKVAEIKKDLAELDGEKVLEVAKEKGELVKDKVDELAVQAKEKATPAIERTISEVREKVIDFLKNTTKKLEKQAKEAKENKK